MGQRERVQVPDVDRERPPVVDPLSWDHEPAPQLPLLEHTEHPERQLKEPVLDAERLPVEFRKRRVPELFVPVAVERCRDLEGS